MHPGPLYNASNITLATQAQELVRKHQKAPTQAAKTFKKK